MIEYLHQVVEVSYLWEENQSLSTSVLRSVNILKHKHVPYHTGSNSNRARILLLKAEGCTIHEIADKVGINRKSVMLCLNKYAEGGVENALFDAPGRGRNAEITDDEKAWIINIACQKPIDFGYAAET